jgi:hypothetical protein
MEHAVQNHNSSQELKKRRINRDVFMTFDKYTSPMLGAWGGGERSYTALSSTA